MTSYNETSETHTEARTDETRHAGAKSARRSPREALDSVRLASRRVMENVAGRGRPALIRVAGRLSEAAAAVQKRLDALKDRLEAAQGAATTAVVGESAES